MDNVVAFPHKTAKGWKLLEKRTIGERTLICWYNESNKTSSLSLFHKTKQPNELSKKSPQSKLWGYVTHVATGMMSLPETAEVVSLYLMDMEKENVWWEEIC